MGWGVASVPPNLFVVVLVLGVWICCMPPSARPLLSTLPCIPPQIFSHMRRLDNLFIPGGDPGGRPPEQFFGVVQKQAAFMKAKFFPNAKVWVAS